MVIIYLETSLSDKRKSMLILVLETKPYLLMPGVWSRCCPLLATVTASQMASGYNLVGLLVVRYLSVRAPLRQHIILTHNRMIGGILGVWIISVALACILYVRSEPGLSLYKNIMTYFIEN